MGLAVEWKPTAGSKKSRPSVTIGTGKASKGIGEVVQDKGVLEGSLSVANIPVLGAIPTSFPKVAPKDVIEYISVPQTPEESFAYIIDKDNMSPTVQVGDYAIFVAGAEAIKNDDVLVGTDESGKVWIRRFEVKDGNTSLVTDNPEYPPVTSADQAIIEKVVRIWRRVPF